MWHLSRYNYSTEHKASIANISGGALSGRLDHIGTKTKFLHFCNKRVHLLVAVKLINYFYPVLYSFDRTDLPTRGRIHNIEFITDISQDIVPAEYIRVKDCDREFLPWYL